jgi:hypothetical protein
MCPSTTIYHEVRLNGRHGMNAIISNLKLLSESNDPNRILSYYSQQDLMNRLLMAGNIHTTT